jgi:Rieske Fe-S protein
MLKPASIGTEAKLKSVSGNGQLRRIFLRQFFYRIPVSAAIAALMRNLAFSKQGVQSPVLATVTLAEHPEIGKPGGSLLLKGTQAGEILVVRTGDEEFAAMSNACPHKQCLVEVKGPTLIRCPCHGSIYQIDGTYVSGPAKKSLKKFTIQIEKGVLTVTEK